MKKLIILFGVSHLQRKHSSSPTAFDKDLLFLTRNYIYIPEEEVGEPFAKLIEPEPFMSCQKVFVNVGNRLGKIFSLKYSCLSGVVKIRFNQQE